MKEVNSPESFQMEVSRLLRQELSEIQSRRPGFSIRRFARQLGVSSQALTQILNGKRPVTLRFAKQVLPHLSLPTEKVQQILAGLPQKQIRKKRSVLARLSSRRVPKQNHELQSAEFHAISDWWYFSILSLAETEGFRSDPEWIAKRLRVPKSAVLKALNQLHVLKLIERRGGELALTGKTLTTTQDVSDTFIRKNHVQGLSLAQEALNRTPVTLREFSSFTVAIDPDRMTEAKTRIQDFLCAFSDEFECGKKKEVYRIQLQLFPLTHTTEKGISP